MHGRHNVHFEVHIDGLPKNPFMATCSHTAVGCATLTYDVL